MVAPAALYTSLEPGPVVPSRNSYFVTPVPDVQPKVAVELVSVLPGVGLVSVAGESSASNEVDCAVRLVD